MLGLAIILMFIVCFAQDMCFWSNAGFQNIHVPLLYLFLHSFNLFDRLSFLIAAIMPVNKFCNIPIIACH